MRSGESSFRSRLAKRLTSIKLRQLIVRSRVFARMSDRPARNADNSSYGFSDSCVAEGDGTSDADPSDNLGRKCTEVGEPRYAGSMREFHRRRAEVEMARALAGIPLSIALRHLELAKLHRAKCAAFNQPAFRPRSSPSLFITKADKEG